MSSTCRAVVAAFLVSMLSATAGSAVPALISYQGQLNDKNGVPVSGTVSFVFSLYDVPTGGTALWTEAQTLPVSNGVFSVQLGAVQALPATLFSKDALYLGVRAGADAEMSPRQRLSAAAYAMKAELVGGLGVPVGTLMPWLKSMPGVPALPPGWLECNGQAVNDPESPLNGRTLPNLNGAANVLRGAASSGVLSYENFLPPHAHDLRGGGPHSSCTINLCGYNSQGGYTAGFISTTSAGAAMEFYSVVWIVKVK